MAKQSHPQYIKRAKLLAKLKEIFGDKDFKYNVRALP
jgi:hypothetical protein